MKLTRAQRQQLQFMASTDVHDITDESVVRALARKGLAERFSPTMGFLRGRHMWRVTDAGRAQCE